MAAGFAGAPNASPRGGPSANGRPSGGGAQLPVLPGVAPPEPCRCTLLRGPRDTCAKGAAPHIRHAATSPRSWAAGHVLQLLSPTWCPVVQHEASSSAHLVRLVGGHRRVQWQGDGEPDALALPCAASGAPVAPRVPWYAVGRVVRAAACAAAADTVAAAAFGGGRGQRDRAEPPRADKGPHGEGSSAVLGAESSMRQWSCVQAPARVCGRPAGHGTRWAHIEQESQKRNTSGAHAESRLKRCAHPMASLSNVRSSTAVAAIR